MKKFFICLLIMFSTTVSTYASNLPDLQYKNLKIKDKITYNTETNVWSKTTDKKSANYFVKTKGFGDFYDYEDSEHNFAFSTNCEYEFIYNNALIGYSNRDMRFYEILYKNNEFDKRALTKDEVEKMLPNYKIISLSEFSSKTNSLKIKKDFSTLKIFLFNDTNNSFDNYVFTSGNSKFEKYDLRGFLSVYKPGMIQFSNLDDLDDKNWYILLIR